MTGNESSALLLDFGANRERGKGNRDDRLFSTGLDEQFGNSRRSATYGGDLEDFVRTEILGRERCWISCPNFDRMQVTDKFGNRYYKNYVVRFRLSDCDVALMGDIYHREGTKRSFKVKGITFMDSGLNHYGEYEAAPITVWAQMVAKTTWESDRQSVPYPSDIQGAELLSDNLMISLAERYVVDDYRQFDRFVSGWEDYLGTRKNILAKKGGEKYPIAGYEAMKAYHLPKSREIPEDERPQFLKTERGSDRWSLRDDTGDAAALLHVWIDLPYPVDDDSLKDQRRKVNSFTRNPNKIWAAGKDKNDYIALGDTRLSAPYLEKVPPRDRLAAIEAKLESEVASQSRAIDRAMEQEVRSRVDAYRAGELRRQLDAYWEAEWDAALARAERSAREGVEARVAEARAEHEAGGGESAGPFDEEALRSSLLESADLEELAAADLEKLEAQRSARLLEEMAGSVREAVTPVYAERKTEVLAGLRAQAQADMEIAEREGSIARWHVYYAPEFDDSADAEVRQIDAYLGGPGDAQLMLDLLGDSVLLNRQSDALRSFREGYVKNPFLATALFSPSRNGLAGTSLPRDVEFYQENLNEGQRTAVRKALSSNGMFLIQGPPGTGKTQVIAEIATQVAKSGRKVLIASETNKAVDNAFDRLPKDPSIRPLRILAKKRASNPYSAEAVLDNFYGNISSALDRSVWRYENKVQYAESLSKVIEDVQAGIRELRASRGQLDEIEKAIEELEGRVARNRDRLQDAVAANQESSMLEDELNALLDGIRDGDLPEELMGKLSSEIQGIIPGGCDSARAEEVVAGLCRYSNDELDDEIGRLEDSRRAIELLEEKKDPATSKNRIVEINRELEAAGGGDVAGLGLYKLFGGELPGNIVRIHQAVRDGVSSYESEKRRSLDRKLQRRTDTAPIESDIKSLQREIKSLESDPEYKCYSEREERLNRTIREAFRDLDMVWDYDDPEDAVERLKDRLAVARATRSSPSEEKRIGMYRRISSYLRKDDVRSQDKDRLLSSVLGYVNVFGMTCTAKDTYQVGGKVVDLFSQDIDVVIVDEVSKVPFISMLYPMLCGKSVILVGDHRQLPPIYSEGMGVGDLEIYQGITDKEKEERYRAMYEEPFFDALFRKTPESNKTSLVTQYRMHPDIMEVDNVFYGDTPLKFGGTYADKEHYLDITGTAGRLISETDHVLFVDCDGRESKFAGSTSYYNEKEVEVVGKLLRMIDSGCRLDRNGNPLSGSGHGRADDRLSVGVITPYKDQIKRIRDSASKHYDSFNQSYDERFMVKSVDDFQGDERDIIIISLVRSRDSPFLKDYRRINVAMSRARRLLIVVGNSSALSKMVVSIDGRDKTVYRDIIGKIRGKGGYRTAADVVGGD